MTEEQPTNPNQDRALAWDFTNSAAGISRDELKAVLERQETMTLGVWQRDAEFLAAQIQQIQDTHPPKENVPEEGTGDQ